MCCQHCGSHLNDQAKFCSECGGRVDSGPSASGRQAETLEIEVLVGDMAYGKSIVTSLLGNPSIYKCKFVARAFSSSGNYVYASAEFSKMGTRSIELLEGQDRRNAQKALDSIDGLVRGDGWQPVERGGSWYSYRYQRAQGRTTNEAGSTAVPRAVPVVARPKPHSAPEPTKVLDLAPNPALIIRGHKRAVVSVAFSPDGQALAPAGCYDNTARIWDLALPSDRTTPLQQPKQRVRLKHQ